MGAHDWVPYVRSMATLHIEHPITDLATWSAAFNALAEARRHAGVVAEQVHQPVGDPQFIVVDLDFDSSEHAEAFLGFLRSVVWAVPESSPALAGAPEAKVLERVELR